MNVLNKERVILLIFSVYGGFVDICCVLIGNGSIINDVMSKGYMVFYFVV